MLADQRGGRAERGSIPPLDCFAVTLLTILWPAMTNLPGGSASERRCHGSARRGGGSPARAGAVPGRVGTVPRLAVAVPRRVVTVPRLARERDPAAWGRLPRARRSGPPPGGGGAPARAGAVPPPR